VSSADQSPEHPVRAVDDRLVEPGSGFEVFAGKILAVPPADEPRGIHHARIVALLDAHVVPEYEVAVDMLTRTAELDDIAPNASVFPRARDPETGGRQIEELVFDFVNTQRPGEGGEKAGSLAARGVRRIFGVDLVIHRIASWTAATKTWEILPLDFVIEDPVLATPLPVRALLASDRTDDTIVRALIDRGHPAILEMQRKAYEAGREEGRKEAAATHRGAE